MCGRVCLVVNKRVCVFVCRVREVVRVRQRRCEYLNASEYCAYNAVSSRIAVICMYSCALENTCEGAATRSVFSTRWYISYLSTTQNDLEIMHERLIADNWLCAVVINNILLIISLLYFKLHHMRAKQNLKKN